MSTYFKDDQADVDSSNSGVFGKMSLYYQAITDKLQFYKTGRWIAVGVVMIFYIIRLFITKGKHNSFISLRLSCTNLLLRYPFIERFYRIHFANGRPRRIRR